MAQPAASAASGPASGALAGLSGWSKRHSPGALGWAWLVNIGLWVVCAALLASHRQGLLADAERQSVTVARLIEQNLVALLDKSAIVVGSTAAELDNQLAHGGIDPSQLWRNVDTRVAQVPQLLRIGVFDSTGQQICGQGADRCMHLQVADRDFFQHHRNGSGTATALHGPHTNRVDGQPAMVLSRALRQHDGSFAGVVVALLPLQRLQDVVAGIDLGPQGVASLRTADLQLLARQPALPVLTDSARRQAVSPQLRAVLTADASAGTVSTLAANDSVRRLTAFRRLTAYPLVVLVGLATADTLGGWYRLVAATAALLLLAGGASVAAVRLARANAASRDEAQALYDTAPCGYHRLDAQGTIVAINSTELGWLGLPRDQVVGRLPFARFMAEGDRADLAANLSALARGQSIEGLEFDLVSAQGQVRRMMVSAHPVLDAQGRFVMTNSVLQDITALKQAESLRLEGALLATRNAQLQEDINFKRALLSNLSHELRTPLNAVIGLSGLLKADTAPLRSAKAVRYLDRIEQAGRQLLTLVESMLTLSQMQAQQLVLQPRQLDRTALGGLLQAAVALQQPAAAARELQLSVAVDGAIGTVNVDPARLQQVLHALLDNAIKFSRAGGCIGLQAAPDGPGHWLLQVQDDGIGIAATDQPRLFQSFGQLDGSSTRAHGGLGLGLALSHRLVQAMGGSLGVQSRPGQGSVFQVRLPRQPGEP